jgi:hypothetical protein
LLVHSDHLGLLCLGLGEGSILLRLRNPLLLLNLLLGFDCGVLLDPLEVVLADNDGIVLRVFLRLLPDLAQFIHRDEAG